jgi:hypothetical protein
MAKGLSVAAVTGPEWDCGIRAASGFCHCGSGGYGNYYGTPNQNLRRYLLFLVSSVAAPGLGIEQDGRGLL